MRNIPLHLQPCPHPHHPESSSVDRGAPVIFSIKLPLLEPQVDLPPIGITAVEDHIMDPWKKNPPRAACMVAYTIILTRIWNYVVRPAIVPRALHLKQTPLEGQWEDLVARAIIVINPREVIVQDQQVPVFCGLVPCPHCLR